MNFSKTAVIKQHIYSKYEGPDMQNEHMLKKFECDIFVFVLSKTFQNSYNKRKVTLVGVKKAMTVVCKT